MMNEKTGQIFSIAVDNAPVQGCTVSKLVKEISGRRISHFSLAAGTDISAETYPAHKFWIAAGGDLAAMDGNGHEISLMPGDIFVTPIGNPIGIKTLHGGIYTEIETDKDMTMNKAIEAGKAFMLKDLLPYAEGRIVNMDIASNPKMKFVLMSFSAGTGLSEHAAPGEAIIFALDGEGIIGYEGKEHVIHAGENFAFAKNGAHWVKAEKPFKMALLLMFD
ncbi:MAG: cupin domain-containing protein [Victivallales bacterium]|nr:cupin domain-containing protein [Victivallales bacterium]MBO7533166.1 cupin domain-containing protein [Victivallales bacterium]